MPPSPSSSSSAGLASGLSSVGRRSSGSWSSEIWVGSSEPGKSSEDPESDDSEPESESPDPRPSELSPSVLPVAVEPSSGSCWVGAVSPSADSAVWGFSSPGVLESSVMRGVYPGRGTVERRSHRRERVPISRRTGTLLGGDPRGPVRGGAMGQDGSNAEMDEREETPKERSTRKWNEMLQELRVAQTGVQVLTGFLLTLPFTQRFTKLSDTDETAYLVTISCAIGAAACLIAPVAFHRVLFGRSEKQWLVVAANQVARVGLTLMALTMTGAIWLVFDVVVGLVAALVAGGLTLAVVAALWVVIPAVAEARDDA